MDARTLQPHYLRFARTLALATTLALPACVGAEDPAATDGQGGPTTTTTTGSGADPSATAAPTATATPTAATLPTDRTIMVVTGIGPTNLNTDMDAGTSDASPGFSSGPLPPPEMPASMA